MKIKEIISQELIDSRDRLTESEHHLLIERHAEHKRLFEGKNEQDVVSELSRDLYETVFRHLTPEEQARRARGMDEAMNRIHEILDEVESRDQ